MSDPDRPVTVSYTIDAARFLIEAAQAGNSETNYSHASVSRSIGELQDALTAAEVKAIA